ARGAARVRGGRAAPRGDRGALGGGDPRGARARRRRWGGGVRGMSEVNDRLAKLTPEQRRLLELRLRERGLGPVAARDGREDGEAAPGRAGEADPDAWRARHPVRPMRFSLYFFSDDGSRETGAKYRLALEG